MRARRWALALAVLAGLFAVACEHFPGRHNYGPPADPRVVEKLCTSDLGGKNAELQVWRDGATAITVYELLPDPDGPHQGVTALYDSRGREQLKMPAPDMKTSPEALERDRRRDQVLEDSSRGETIECGRDGG